jgi:hypothetical protein
MPSDQGLAIALWAGVAARNEAFRAIASTPNNKSSEGGFDLIVAAGVQ